MALLWAILFLSFFCRFGTFCNYLQFIFLHLRQHLENKATRFHFYQVPLNQYIWSLNQMFITKNQDLADQRSLIIFLYHFYGFLTIKDFSHESAIINLWSYYWIWIMVFGPSWILIIQHLYFSLLHGTEPLAHLWLYVWRPKTGWLWVRPGTSDASWRAAAIFWSPCCRPPQKSTAGQQHPTTQLPAGFDAKIGDPTTSVSKILQTKWLKICLG